MDVQGVITQFTSSSSVYNDGYQLQPGALTDFITPPVPVELLSFSSIVQNEISL